MQDTTMPTKHNSGRMGLHFVVLLSTASRQKIYKNCTGRKTTFGQIFYTTKTNIRKILTAFGHNNDNYPNIRAMVHGWRSIKRKTPYLSWKTREEDKTLYTYLYVCLSSRSHRAIIMHKIPKKTAMPSSLCWNFCELNLTNSRHLLTRR